jgi:hypothetical protein
MKRGTILINGQPLEEPYVKYRKHPSWDTPDTLVLSEHQYLVIGDNRSMPWEHHYFGLADFRQIVGKVIF